MTQYTVPFALDEKIVRIMPCIRYTAGSGGQLQAFGNANNRDLSIGALIYGGLTVVVWDTIMPALNGAYGAISDVFPVTGRRADVFAGAAFNAQIELYFGGIAAATPTAMFTQAVPYLCQVQDYPPMFVPASGGVKGLNWTVYRGIELSLAYFTAGLRNLTAGIVGVGTWYMGIKIYDSQA